MCAHRNDGLFLLESLDSEVVEGNMMRNRSSFNTLAASYLGEDIVQRESKARMPRKSKGGETHYRYMFPVSVLLQGVTHGQVIFLKHKSASRGFARVISRMKITGTRAMTEANDFRLNKQS